jgi:hypothetical protein
MYARPEIAVVSAPEGLQSVPQIPYLSSCDIPASNGVSFEQAFHVACVVCESYMKNTTCLPS